MTDWIESNYQTALDYLSDNEEKLTGTLHFQCTREVSVVLPVGLPALGVKFHGAFMLAPLPIFMLSVISLPILGFSTSWGISINSLAITLGCGLLLYGLYKCLMLLLSQRELFPRENFTTLGTEGVAMHYSRIHLFWNNPKAFLHWNEIQSVEKTTVPFLPALLIGCWQVPALQLNGVDGKKIFLPYRLNSVDDSEINALETFLHSKIR